MAPTATPAAARVVTVRGAMDPATLGVTLPHEHVLWASHYADHPTGEMERLRTRAGQPVTDALVPELRRNPFATRDNLVQHDIDLAVAEITAFREAGGGAVVDLTCTGVGRDVLGLREVARRSGVAIVAATGYYLENTHPPGLAGREIDDIATEFVRDLTSGMDGTDVRAGIIGELGVGAPMYGLTADGPRDRADMGRVEERVLVAAARAQRATGAPISVHLWNFGPNDLARRALDVLDEAGAQLDRVVIGHLDAWCDPEAIRGVVRRGAFAELDAFGVEPYEGWAGSHFETDETRIQTLLDLLDAGLEDRLLISQDVCTKVQLRRFGGTGYDHIERTIVPALRARGVTGETLATMRIHNPARLLAW